MFHEPIETPDVQNNMFRLQNSLECLNGTPPPLDYASLECLEICRLGKAINASTWLGFPLEPSYNKLNHSQESLTKLLIKGFEEYYKGPQCIDS